MSTRHTSEQLHGDISTRYTSENRREGWPARRVLTDPRSIRRVDLARTLVRDTVDLGVAAVVGARWHEDDVPIVLWRKNTIHECKLLDGKVHIQHSAC